MFDIYTLYKDYKSRAYRDKTTFLSPHVSSHITTITSATIASHTIPIFLLTFKCPAADTCESFPAVLVAVGPKLPLEALAPVTNPDESAAPNPFIDEKGMVLAPITMSELPSDIAVPESVIAVLPWKTSVPEIAKPLG